MRHHRFLFVLAIFVLVNIACWFVAARYLKQQMFAGLREPYTNLFNTIFPFDSVDAGPRSRFVQTDWVFPKDAPVVGPNGETRMSLTTDGHTVSVSVRKGTMYYHSPLSFEQVCSLYRQKPSVEEDRNAFEGVATDSNQHAVFVCYGSRYNIFLLVTHIPASPMTNVTIDYRAIDVEGLPTR